MSSPTVDSESPSEGKLFRKILGPEWKKLHPDIQQRFAKNPVVGKPLYYKGTLSELSCSFFGKLLGYLTMPIIKGALLPFNDVNFPVDIEVYAKPNCPFIFKQRKYHLNNRQPIMFTSYMQESAAGEVLEYVGRGLGMKLILRVEDGNLHFTSDGYFWKIFGLRIPLPGILTPGKTFLCHQNDSINEFNIRIEIKHCLFGKTFTQVGKFKEVKIKDELA
ncbi:hypothetical protein MNBD_GAMMA12-1373 [hydrothermal vent metagenome]|uniref:DUF4166 domain-containing protein n=1 Tax=hydrothermal vent metagenome TaxID=652676 RepID=A0A3B0YQL6_9ZZZZ